MPIEIVSLDLIHPNPVRDFEINPIEESDVKSLIDSINATPMRFQGALLARRRGNGTYEIAWGHTRVSALKVMGEKTVALDVREKISRKDMALAMALENRTQKGGKAAATADAVAAAIRVIYGDALRDSFSSIDEKLGKGGGPQIINGQIGEPAITAFLNRDGKSFTNVEVRVALASLKKTGDYDRILDLERAAFEADQLADTPKSAGKAVATAKQSKQREVTLDKRVLKLLDNDAQVRTIQSFVEDEAVKAALPVDQQFGLVKQIVETRQAEGQEITARQLHRDLYDSMQSATRKVTKKATDEERAAKLAAAQSASRTIAHSTLTNLRDYLNSFLSMTDNLRSQYAKNPEAVAEAMQRVEPTLAKHLSRLDDAVEFITTVIESSKEPV